MYKIASALIKVNGVTSKIAPVLKTQKPDLPIAAMAIAALGIRGIYDTLKEDHNVYRYSVLPDFQNY